MDHVVGPAPAVADAGAVGGQQVEEVVVRGAGDLGVQGGGEVDAIVPESHLGGQGAQGGAGIDPGVGNGGLGSPAVQGEAHGGPVSSGQAGQPPVGEREPRIVFRRQVVFTEGTEHLVDPARGYAAHQSGQLFPGAQGPGGQQVQSILFGPG